MTQPNSSRRRLIIGATCAAALTLLGPFNLFERSARADEGFQVLEGRVKTVQDGDTLEVLDDSGHAHWIRLKNIDAPEKSQPMGRSASRALAAKVAGGRVTIRYRERDRYDRIVGTVQVDGRDINRELVAEGWAWVYRHYCEDPTFLSQEATARGRGTHLWSQDAPEPPWEWRRRQRLEARETL